MKFTKLIVRTISAFFTSSLLTQFTSLLTTSAFSVLGFLLFPSFISVSKYSFQFFNTASEFTITLPFSSFITLTCCTQQWILGEANEAVASGPPFFLGVPPRKQHIQFWIRCRCLFRGRF